MLGEVQAAALHGPVGLPPKQSCEGKGTPSFCAFSTGTGTEAELPPYQRVPRCTDDTIRDSIQACVLGPNADAVERRKSVAYQAEKVNLWRSRFLARPIY